MSDQPAVPPGPHRAAPFSLVEVAEALADNGPSWQHYLDGRTGDVVTVPEGADGEFLELVGATESEVEELVEQGAGLVEYDAQRFVWVPSDDYPELPVMRDFARSQDPGPPRDRLVDATYGLGLYRRFKEELGRQGLVDDWYAYRLREFAAFAREWLVNRGLPFMDDAGQYTSS